MTDERLDPAPDRLRSTHAFLAARGITPEPGGFDSRQLVGALGRRGWSAAFRATAIWPGGARYEAHARKRPGGGPPQTVSAAGPTAAALAGLLEAALRRDEGAPAGGADGRGDDPAPVRGRDASPAGRRWPG